MAELCCQCPRACLVDRSKTVGFCGVSEGFVVARAARHAWEEPIISGKNGSGTIFFGGCNLRCVFCQNRDISHTAKGKPISDAELMKLMLRLQDEGAHNINLVTPTQYAKQLRHVLECVKPQLHIPVVYNCGGYESVETLRALEGLVDIWLPDFKYYSSTLSKKYSAAGDYYEVAIRALAEMLRQCPRAVYDGDGMLLRGVVVRHLVLPGGRKDSIEVLNRLVERFGSESFLLSLMSQYTPSFAKETPYRELHREVTTFEYQSVADVAVRLGLQGFFQSKDSATADYTPDFSEETL
ncbi:MAG: radical SAM protein [Clostridia bacterium]|nr:radical SAM protein [Clostridia bacterium]